METKTRDVTQNYVDEEVLRWKGVLEERKEAKERVEILREEHQKFVAEPARAASMGPLKIIFIGPKGSGKTALIHQIEQAYYNYSGCTSAVAGLPTTYVTHHWLPENKSFMLIDTPGIKPSPQEVEYVDGYDPDTFDADSKSLVNLVEGNIPEGEAPIDAHLRAVPPKGRKDTFNDLWTRAHAVVFVFSVNDFIPTAKRSETTRAYASVRKFLRWNSKFFAYWKIILF